MLIREKKQLVIVIVAAVILLGFLLFRYIPLRRKSAQIALATTQLNQAIDQASIQSRQLPLLREELVNLQKTTGDYDVKVPSQRALGGFLQDIATVMDKHNLEDQKVHPQLENEAGGLRNIPVMMYCKGTIYQIFEFYKSLQQLSRAIRVEDISLVNDSGYSGLINMQTKVIIYYMPQS